MIITPKSIMDKLKEIPDPELGISIVDLGLIYNIEIDNSSGFVRIIMTLTSVGCPLYELIHDPIIRVLKKDKRIKKFDIQLTFEPPWTPDLMTKQARMSLGML